jgi:hypothetical protein
MHDLVLRDQVAVPAGDIEEQGARPSLPLLLGVLQKRQTLSVPSAVSMPSV